MTESQAARFNHLVFYFLKVLQIVPLDIFAILYSKVTEHPLLRDLALWHSITLKTQDMEDEFLIELHKLMLEYEELIDRYEMRGRLLSIFAAGILDPIDDENSTMKASYNYMLDSKEEMDVMLDFINDTYHEHKNMDDLEDLLGGMGISLN